MHQKNACKSSRKAFQNWRSNWIHGHTALMSILSILLIISEPFYSLTRLSQQNLDCLIYSLCLYLILWCAINAYWSKMTRVSNILIWSKNVYFLFKTINVWLMAINCTIKNNYRKKLKVKNTWTFNDIWVVSYFTTI